MTTRKFDRDFDTCKGVADALFLGGAHRPPRRYAALHNQRAARDPLRRLSPWQTGR